MAHNNKTSNIAVAVTELQAGNLVAFPTETVYGLGADARNPVAIQKVFAAKGRPADHPVIVHIPHVQQLSVWAKNIPAAALILAQHFWPGPLTLLLQKQNGVSDLITGAQDSIGIRIPNHPLALQLLQQFGSGIVGPSANKYGRVSPTTADHVATDLADVAVTILDGGACQVGIESTIVDLTSATPRIMRTGAISAAEISAALQQDVKVHTGSTTLRTSGSHAAHYAPHTPVHIMDYDQILMELNKRSSISVISFNAAPTQLNSQVHWQQVALDPQQYAHDLYANLRAHDNFNASAILIEAPPMQAAWLALIDRLTRAATR